MKRLLSFVIINYCFYFNLCGLLGKADVYYFNKLFGIGKQSTSEEILRNRNIYNEFVHTQEYGLFEEIKEININNITEIDERNYQIIEQVETVNVMNKENQINYFGNYQPPTIGVQLKTLENKRIQLIKQQNIFNENSTKNELNQWKTEYEIFLIDTKRIIKNFFLKIIQEYAHRYELIFKNKKGAKYIFSNHLEYNNSNILRFIFETRINPPGYQFYSYQQLKNMEKLLYLISDLYDNLVMNKLIDKDVYYHQIRLNFKLTLLSLSELKKLDINLLDHDELQFGSIMNKPVLKDNVTDQRKQLRERFEIESKLIHPEIIKLFINDL